MHDWGGYGHGGWMGLWWVVGLAALIAVVWLAARRRGGS